MAKAQSKRFWEVKNAANKDLGELYVYGSIVSSKWEEDEVTAGDIKKALDALGPIKTLDIYVNSPGGSVFVAQAIYSMLNRHTAKKRVFIDGLAASAASFLAMVGEVFMPRNAMMMVHKPWNIVLGNATDLRKAADRLDKVQESMAEVYLSKVKIPAEELAELLEAETWMTAEDCLKYGFCDQIIADKEVAACVDPEIFAHYQHVPQQLLTEQLSDSTALSDAERQALLAEAKANLERTKSILGGM